MANKYTIGWICAVVTEYVAARALLDQIHDGPDTQAPNDNNTYTLGEIGKHNVVVAVLPDGEYGTSSAASVVKDMLRTFTNIRIALMVGIGGGAPSAANDIRLGDIVVSSPRNGIGGVIQYDFGKSIQDQGFCRTGILNQPPALVRTAVTALRAEYISDGHNLQDIVSSVLQKKPRLRKSYARPDPNSDILYRPAYLHHGRTCCTVDHANDESKVIVRRPREEDDDTLVIHYGLIASGNALMKDASIRDKLAAETGVLCFEMEAAGLMNQCPFLIIRGICDYSDTHKNKSWQGYAAMAAAAYARALLYRIPASKVDRESRITEMG
jgi:nucleoside phosphorylase